MSQPPKPVRKGTLLPSYSAYPPLASIKAAIAATIRPSRTFSTDTYNSVDDDFSPIISHTGRIIGSVPIVHSDEPVSQLSSVAPPPPPEYSGSTKPVLLWLDGGGTKIIIETYFLADIMRRLAWDLKYSDDQPSSPKYAIPPKDCFDWIAGCGCSAIIVLSIACGMVANDIQKEVMNLAASLRNGDLKSIREALEDMILTSTLNGDDDPPAQTNVWLPAESNVMRNQGTWYASSPNLPSKSESNSVKKGDSIRNRLLPVVMQEIEKELNGAAEFLDCTEAFLHSVCPIFADCSFLLSLGSGQVPADPPPQTWWQWMRGENLPSLHPPLPPSKKIPKTTVIPSIAFSTGNETYIRFHPEIFGFDQTTNSMKRLDDWTTDFSEFRSLSSSYMNKSEIVQKLNRAAYMLRWKDIPGPRDRAHPRSRLGFGRNTDSRTRDLT